MLSVITGKQRSGKSYYAVHLIIEYLRDSDRHIYTNLSIKPDAIARYVCRGNPVRMDAVLSRIHIFFPVGDYPYLRSFCRTNRWYVARYGKTNLISADKVHAFWDHTLPNSVILLDEVYEYFSCSNYRSAKGDSRERLLAYTRQHGHRMDDLYLISHSIEDLDSFIRRGIQYLYVVRNSKYVNMFGDHPIFRGLRWPWQIFFIEGYAYGDRNPTDYHRIWPVAGVFSLYDSFSKSSIVRGMGLADGQKMSSASSDVRLGYSRIFVRYLRQVAPLILIVLSLAVGAYAAWAIVSSFSVVMGRNAYIPSPQPVVAVPANENEEEVCNVAEEIPPPVYLSPVSVSSSSIRYPDGTIIRRGDMHEGMRVVDFCPRYVILLHDDVSISVPLGGVVRCQL